MSVCPSASSAQTSHVSQSANLFECVQIQGLIYPCGFVFDNLSTAVRTKSTFQSPPCLPHCLTVSMDVFLIA